MPARRRRSPLLTVAALLACGALVAPRAQAQGPGTPEIPVEASAAAAAAAVPTPYALDFEFVADDGSRVRLDHWAGQPVLMAMAYSNCRETCIYTMRRLEELERAARQRGAPLEVVVVSCDPASDDAAAWASYRRRHGLNDGHWHFLVGPVPATRALANLLGLTYWTYDEHVTHGFGITLVDSSGRVARVLKWTNRNEDLLAAANAP